MTGTQTKKTCRGVLKKQKLIELTQICKVGDYIHICCCSLFMFVEDHNRRRANFCYSEVGG